MTRAGIRKRDRGMAIAAANRRRAEPVRIGGSMGGVIYWDSAVEAAKDLNCSPGWVRRFVRGKAGTGGRAIQSRVNRLLTNCRDELKHGRVEE